MASSDSRPSSSGSSSKNDSIDIPVAVPPETPRQGTQSPLEGETQTAKGSVEVKWEFFYPSEGSSQSSAILDIVIIQGLYGSGKELAEEATQNWTHKYLRSFSLGSRLMLFEWDSHNIFAGTETRSVIGALSRCLLRGLSNVGGEESMKRSIMFVTDDLGSLILKDALMTASASTDRSWLDIVDRTRALVFRGCPHRSVDQREMEEKLAEFVWAARINAVSPVARPTLAAMPGLAEAATHINGLFILAKMHMKCHLISIHHGGRYHSSEPSGQKVFDEFSGTFGLPFERRIENTISKTEETNEQQVSPILQYLESLTVAGTWPDTKENEWLEHRHERTLICLSSPVATFRTSQFEQWSLLQNAKAFTEWRDAINSDLLYVHGGIDMTETSEQLFYVLDQQAIRQKEHKPVLYFSFNKNDTTRNTLKDMLATFIGQMIYRYANSVGSWAQLMFVQLNEEHAWTDRDLLQWFSHYSSIFLTNSAYLVIDGFDECPKAGRDSFLEWFDRRLASEETHWKVAIISRRPVSSLQGLQAWREIDLSIVMASDESVNTGIQSVKTMEVKSLLSRYRPELLINEAWAQSTNWIPSGDPLIQKILLENCVSISEWPRKLSVKDIFNIGAGEESGDELLVKILDSVFRRLPDQFQVRTMLTWLLHSMRPLSLWELASVMCPEGLDNPRASPGPDSVRELLHICETQLRGIIEIRDTTVRLRNSRLREILTKRPPAGSPSYIWNDIDSARAPYDITKFCLQFLARFNVQQELESMVEQSTSSESTYRTASGYTNFCSYAAYYWPRHAALIPTTKGLSSLLEEYKQTALNTTWLKAYWCLENPVTRIKEPLESVDVLLASWKLPHSHIGTWDQRSISFASQIAAAQGQHKMVKTLLHRCEQSNAALMSTLVAASSSGQEELALHVLSHVKKAKYFESEAHKWPPCLLYRAAWLGMDRFAKALLEAGCPPEPGGPMAGKPRISPLHQAARHGHIATLEVLLSHGADTSFKTLYDRSILFTATYYGRPKVFKTLFEKGNVDVMGCDEDKESPLMFAAQWGRTVALKSLLEIGADPHDDKDLTSSEIGWLPLVTACSRGYIESVRILLDNDADPNQPGPKGVSTAVWYAAVNNHPQIVRALLEKGADPNHPLLELPILVDLVRGVVATPERLESIDLMLAFGARIESADGDGDTALMYAIQNGEEGFVAKLLEHGASVDAENQDKRRPLHLAAIQGSENILNLVLAKNPDLDCQDTGGNTALSLAVEFANLARILLERGANPDLPRVDGWTPLISSACDGYTKTVEALLDHHAQLELQTVMDDDDTGGWTAVGFAAINDHPDIVKLLVDAGAVLSHKSQQGTTPLHLATPSTARVLLQHRKRLNIDERNNLEATPLRSSRSTEVSKLLIDGGANLNLQDDDGDTPLAFAASQEHAELVKTLLQEEECDPNLASHLGRTPLHYAAAFNESLETVKLLVEGGADVNRVGSGLAGSPLQASCENAKAGREIIEYLLDNGADLHAQAGTKGFAISAAAVYSTPEIISLLLQRGATTNVRDGMGRTPIHLSSMSGALNFQEIYKAGGNQILQDKDKLQRTIFHWAAQHRLPEVLEDLITELGTGLINEPDVDGWTPLMWACRPGRATATDEYEPEQHQARVFRVLVANGARRDVTGKIGDTVWSLRDVALFNNVGNSCLQQLDALTSITVQSAVPSEITDTTKKRIGALMNYICDACYYDIRGLVQTCSKCRMDLCDKCYRHRDLIHEPFCGGNEWKQNGPEFEEEIVPVEPVREEKVVEHGDEDEDSESSRSSDSESDTG